jgi:hypothetical protein
VYGVSTNSIGVSGVSTSNYGVYGVSTSSIGVYGVSTNGIGGSIGIEGTATGSNSNPTLRVQRTQTLPNGQSYNLSGDLIKIIDNPTNSGSGTVTGNFVNCIKGASASVLSISSVGHIVTTALAANNTPTIDANGTLTTGSTDTAGSATIAALQTTTVITFGTAYAVTPKCVQITATSVTGGSPYISALGTTSFTLVGVAGEKYYYLVVG